MTSARSNRKRGLQLARDPLYGRVQSARRQQRVRCLCQDTPDQAPARDGDRRVHLGSTGGCERDVLHVQPDRPHRRQHQVAIVGLGHVDVEIN